MLFSGIPFLFYFLPAVLLVYFALPKAWKNGFLLLSSLLFYAWGEPRHVLLMAGAILAFWAYGLRIGRTKSKFWLTAAVLTGAAMLLVFKYADFALENWNSLTGMGLPLLKLALPIGISFYTFQCVSYAVDVYRGDTAPQKNIIDFGAYVALFPQLIAGPIVRYSTVADEIVERSETVSDAAAGASRFLVGLGKKVLLSNALAQIADSAFSQAPEALPVSLAWLGILAYTAHIYFDFAGYSDMAIGLGRILGFRFIENFNYPYLSQSVAEFWRRWHMSLGSWFRDYVYIPLGGNRVSRGRWLFNTLVVWMLTGLWHGAAWNFVLWGLLFAALLLLEKVVPALGRMPRVLRHGYVLLAVVLSFVLFNAENMTQLAGDFRGLFGFAGLPLANAETLYYLRSYAVLFVLGVIGCTPIVRDTCNRLSGKKWMAVVEPVVLALLLVTCTAYLVDGSFSPFLYFRF